MSINSQPGRTFLTGENISTATMAYTGTNAQNVMEGGTAITLADTGWTNSKYDHAVVQVGVATKIRSGDIVFRIEGRSPSIGGRPASVLATLFSDGETMDRAINVAGKMSQLRIGVLSTVVPASHLASPCNVYAGIIFSDIK